VLRHPLVFKLFGEGVALLLLPVPAFLGESGQTPGKAIVALRQFLRGLHLAAVDLLDAARVVPDGFGAVGGEGFQFAGALSPRLQRMAGNSLQDAANSLLGWINSLFGAN